MSDKYRAAIAVCSGVLCSLLCFEFSGITYGGNSYNIVDAVNMAMKGEANRPWKCRAVRR